MATPVAARIVVAQATYTPPVGYVAGSVDDLLLGEMITLTNTDNSGAIAWKWEIFAATGVSSASYGIAGAESSSCTLTPPASTGFGDVAARLTVYGDPLPGGRPNVATDEVILGIRAPNAVYTAGVPIPHPHEGSLGRGASIDPVGGREERVAEALRAVALGAGGGGVTSGLVTKSIAAGGTIVVSAEEAAAAVLELTGSAASDVLLQFPTTPGTRTTVRNLSTDRTKYVLLDDGGAGLLLPPGASRVVGVGTDGVLFAADGMGLGWEFQLLIDAGGIGDNDTYLMAVPAGHVLHEAYSYLKAMPTDVSSDVEDSIGVSDSTIIKTGVWSGLGAARGIDPADYGTAFAVAFNALLTTATRVLTHRHTVTVASAAGGQIVVTLTGKRLTA